MQMTKNNKCKIANIILYDFIVLILRTCKFCKPRKKPEIFTKLKKNKKSYLNILEYDNVPTSKNKKKNNHKIKKTLIT